MTQSPEGLYMQVPIDALSSVLFRTSKLSGEGASLVPWSGRLVELNDDEATICLAPEGSIIFSGYSFLGHAARNSHRSFDFISAAYLLGQGPIPTLAPECTVCQTKRARYHFVFQKGSEVISAGYECLSLAGIGVNRLSREKFLAGVMDPRTTLVTTVSRVMSRPTFDTLECLAAAIFDYRERGYISRKRSEKTGAASTSQSVLNLLSAASYRDDRPSEISDNLLTAAVMRNELTSMDREGMSEFHSRAIAALGKARTHTNSVYLVAALPSYYFSERTLPQHLPRDDSSWIGTVGERIDVDCTLEQIVPIASEYSDSLQKVVFCGTAGQRLSWFTQSSINARTGEPLLVRGTVKRHDTYQNVKETVLTRCVIRAR